MDTIDQPGARLTEWDRELIARARQLARSDLAYEPSRALARELLKQLADLAERLGGEA
jgi:hypothetical protein